MYAEFNTDSCSPILGLPTCAEWIPSDYAFLKLLTQQAPSVIGAWCLIAIISASMSTCDGAILALGTVFGNNVIQPISSIYNNRPTINGNTLLTMVRISTIPFTAIAGAVAAYTNIAGKLLIVAFDVVLATAIAPLFGAFYTKNPSPCAALLSIIFGGITRIIMEFTIPKDGSFLLPFLYDEFKTYGKAASLHLPKFVDAPSGSIWNPNEQKCDQGRFKDYSGVDSLTAFIVSVVTFVLVQLIEHYIGKPIFRFTGDVGYNKTISIESLEKDAPLEDDRKDVEQVEQEKE